MLLTHHDRAPTEHVFRFAPQKREHVQRSLAVAPACLRRGLLLARTRDPDPGSHRVGADAYVGSRVAAGDAHGGERRG